MPAFAVAADAVPDDELILLQYSADTKRREWEQSTDLAGAPRPHRQNLCVDDESFASGAIVGDANCFAAEGADTLAEARPPVKASPSQSDALASENAASPISGSFIEQAVVLALVGCLLQVWCIFRGPAPKRLSARALRFLASSPIEPAARPLVVPPVAPQQADPSAALLRAAQAGDVAGLAEALRGGARLGAEDNWGCRALHFSARAGSAAAVKLLLSRGATVDVLEAWDETPLHLAAAAGHSEVCELLLDGGAAVNAANGSDQTPLFAATKAGHGVTAGLLRAHGGVGGYKAPVISSDGAGDEAQ